MTASQAYSTNLKLWSDIQDHLPLLKDSAHGDCMEIGVRGDMSTSAILAGIEEKGGHLYSVDINHCPIFHGHPQWTFINEDSHKPELIWPKLPEKLELLFVDGDHTYEGCLRDLINYAPRAKKVLVHDTGCPVTFPGVRLAVEEYAASMKRNLSFNSGSYGMGIIE